MAWDSIKCKPHTIFLFTWWLIKLSILLVKKKDFAKIHQNLSSLHLWASVNLTKESSQILFMRKSCIFTLISSLFIDVVSSSCLNILSLDVLHSFFVYVDCICILPTDMHCHQNNRICWQLQLVEKLSTHIFVLATEIKSVFNQSPPDAFLFAVLLWMRLNIA